MINTSFYSGLATVLHTIAGFVVNKAIAITVGPSGVALVSQFQNFITINTSIATAGINQGVIKYVAEFKENKTVLAKLVSTSFRISLFSAIGLGTAIVVFNDMLNNYLFSGEEFNDVVIFFGLCLILFSCNQLLMGVLNGMGEIKKFIWSKMTASSFLLIVTSLACYFYGLYGALLTLAVSNSVVIIFTLYFVIKSDWFSRTFFLEKIDRGLLKKLSGFSLMTLTSMVIPPLVQIEIRNHIIDTISSFDAGLWDGIWKISAAYLSIITTTLGVYYLPKLSSISEKYEIRKEIIDGYKIILPFLIILLVAVYFARDFVILILYTDDFLSMNELFLGQIVGDFFKITSWMIAYIMIAKAKVKLFIITQISFSAITYFLSIYMINELGLNGVVYAHAIKFALYTIVVAFLLREYIFIHKFE